MRVHPVLAVAALCPLLLLIAGVASGCGAGKPADAAGPGARAASAMEMKDAGAGEAADAAPPPRPFAGSPAEATQLMTNAVETRSDAVAKCVDDYRARKYLRRERVTITMGIDQEGRLLGATLPKGKSDPALSACVQAALADAPFPRSHSGVISITKTYEEIAQ